MLLKASGFLGRKRRELAITCERFTELLFFYREKEHQRGKIKRSVSPSTSTPNPATVFSDLSLNFPQMHDQSFCLSGCNSN